MLFFLPVLFLILTGLVLSIVHFSLPRFKHLWLTAVIGGLFSLGSAGFWMLRMPFSQTLPAWKPLSIYGYSPIWLADGVSFPYSFALVILLTAILITSVVRNENDPRAWAGCFFTTALGVLAVSAGNPLTLIMAWTALDLVELITLLLTARREARNVQGFLTYALRLVGTGIVIWAAVLSPTPTAVLDFEALPGKVGVFLLIASGLRLGVLPLQTANMKENILPRGLGSSLRLVSAASSLAWLARLPALSLGSLWSSVLLAVVALMAIYAGWMWLRASDETLGRPFWILGLASLAAASMLRSNSLGSIGWGVILILSGGLIFLYSSRHRSIIWLPLLGLWGLAALPFSPAAIAWLSPDPTSWWSLILLLPAQALLLAGFFRHIRHPGDSSFESQERWGRVLYPAGLSLLVSAFLLLGFLGWEGAARIGIWWTGILVILLASGLTLLIHRWLPQSQSLSSRGVKPWSFISIDRVFHFIFRSLEKFVGLVTFTLEGEGGIFWSILLLVLLLSLLSTGGSR